MWENQERNEQPLSFARFNGQDYAHVRGKSVFASNKQWMN